MIESSNVVKTKNSSKEFYFSSKNVEDSLKNMQKQGITRLIVHDPAITTKKESFLRFLRIAQRDASELFYIFYLSPQIIDREICTILENLYCTIQFHISDNVDKRLFQRKTELLNRMGLIFGFNLDIFTGKDDTIKKFRERLDFALSCYPNHIDFFQLEKNLPPSTGCFSSQDIKNAFNIAFACSVFYSAGRAVPWFLSIIRPLKISPIKFFSDFSEWLQCNNCGYETKFDPFSISHMEIEKMQLLFIQLKYEEKNLHHIFPIVQEIVRLNGAFSRLAGENEESVIDLIFNPDDLLSPYANDILQFADNVCMEQCKVKIYTSVSTDGTEFPDYKIL